jgi:hypothetical protein
VLRASVGVNQQQRRSMMAVEITKPNSKIEAEVIKAIKSGFATLAKQNSWVKMTGWKKPGDHWYNQVEDGAMIEIQTVHNTKPDHHYMVLFLGVPKKGKEMLRVNVATLPFTK